MEPVSRKELMRRMRDGTVTVLDDRPDDEFRAWTFTRGALNIPLHALKKRLSRLKKSREIVAYPRGPYCVLSYEAVAALRAQDFNARRLEDGSGGPPAGPLLRADQPAPSAAATGFRETRPAGWLGLCTPTHV